MLRFILFGGAFDPVHRGHLAIADGLYRYFPLPTRTIFIPIGIPPHKMEYNLSPVHIRFALLAASLLDRPWCSIWDAEILRMPLVSYTVDTLQEFHLRFDSRPEEVAFVMGLDSLLQWHTWKDFPRHLELCHWFIVQRPPLNRPVMEDYLSRYLPGHSWIPAGAFRPGLAPSIVYFDQIRMDVSSTMVRERAQRGEPYEYLIPPAAAALIQRHGWYSAPMQDSYSAVVNNP